MEYIALRDLFAIHAPPRPNWFSLPGNKMSDPYYGTEYVSLPKDSELDAAWPYHWADLQMKERDKWL